jgi:PilZ domain
MSLLSASHRPRPVLVEHRRHQRVKVALLGRYMLQNRQEYPCQSIDISPGGVAMVAPVPGNIGERVIVYFEHVGRVEGKIVRYVSNGFALAMQTNLHKRDRLAAQLTWLANRSVFGLPEDRRHERIAPRNDQATLTLLNGESVPVQILDISLSGAALQCSLRPDLGEPITLGRTPGKVVRHFATGIAVEFQTYFLADTFGDDVMF